MNLSEGTTGNTYIVENLNLPVNLERRLEALGVISGTPLKILNSKKQGAVIIYVRGSRFAVGYNIAKNIKIRK